MADPMLDSLDAFMHSLAIQSMQKPFVHEVSPISDASEEKARFFVAEFGLGNTNGHRVNFYPNIEYPTVHSTSVLLFDFKRNQFEFDLKPLSADHRNPITASTTPAFPWSSAPAAARHLRGIIAIGDILGRGIGYFADPEQVEVWLPDRKPDGQWAMNTRGRSDRRAMSPEKGRPAYPRTGHRGGSMSPFSVDSASSRSASPAASPPPSFAFTNTEGTHMELRTKVTLTISLRRPPAFTTLVTSEDGKPCRQIDAYANLQRGQYFQTRKATSWDFVDKANGIEMVLGDGADGRDGETDAGLITVEADQETFKVSNSLAYRFIFLMTHREYARLRDMLEKLRVLSRTDPALAPALTGTTMGSDIITLLAPTPQRRHARSRAPRIMGHAPSDIIEAASLRECILPFSTRWLIEGLVSQGILLPIERWNLLEALDEFTPIREANGEEGLVIPGETDEAKAVRVAEASGLGLRERVLEVLFNEERIAHIPALIRKRAAQLSNRRATYQAHLLQVYRVQITPTRILLFPPAPETSNSVLRKFRHVEQFLRVSFSDEEESLFISDGVREADRINPNAGILARIRRALKHGLELAGRHYVWLAAGTSQARQHGCWFLHETNDLHAGRIRTGIGDIQEQVVAKYSARLGQAFSTTRPVPLEVRRVKELDDIKRNGYTFTDGAGACGINIAMRAAHALGFRTGIHSTPSAIQVRYGGCKGVLSVHPLIKPADVRVRPSMEKFKSHDKVMNVVRIAEYRVAHLNRQFIVILSALGIEDWVFKDLFTAAIEHIRGLPLRVASGQSSERDVKDADSLSSFPVRALITAGFHRDPLIQNVLRVVECRLLSDLRWRARLQIPKGVYLIGIPDEFGVLEEGELFCQFSDPDEGDGNVKHIVKGKCVATRAPAMHPGDIRLVTAVDRRELHHLVNVIIFSTKGHQDIPNMLGGGDLDGDDFTLIWDPAFFFKHNYPPMSYEAPPPKKVSKVTQTHIKENFVDYVKNDILGQVANCHLAWADQESPLSNNCIELAGIHSTAVDFAKTGYPANIPSRLRIKHWPMYLGKDEQISYESKEILGQLFRIVDPDPQFQPVSETYIQEGYDVRLKSIEVPPKIMRLAGALKHEYDLALWQIMLRYRLTEAEACSGVVLRNPRRKNMRDGDLKDPVCDAFREIVHNALDTADRETQKIYLAHRLTGAQLFAVAAYQVIYDPDHLHYLQGKRAMDSGLLGSMDEMDIYVDVQPRQLISFAWVGWKRLLSILNDK